MLNLKKKLITNKLHNYYIYYKVYDLSSITNLHWQESVAANCFGMVELAQEVRCGSPFGLLGKELSCPCF